MPRRARCIDWLVAASLQRPRSPRGTVNTREMLTANRPGYGIKPRDVELVVGRHARVDIPGDEVVTWEMV